MLSTKPPLALELMDRIGSRKDVANCFIVLDTIWGYTSGFKVPKLFCQVPRSMSMLCVLQIGIIIDNGAVSTDFCSLALLHLKEFYSEWARILTMFLFNNSNLCMVQCLREFNCDIKIVGMHLCPSLHSIGLSLYDDGEILLVGDRPEVTVVDILLKIEAVWCGAVPCGFTTSILHRAGGLFTCIFS